MENYGMPQIVPAVMSWARESAGLSLEDAARKLGFKDSIRQLGVDRLAGLERGDVAPSRSVLLRMAKLYRRPLVTFYLSAPPQSGDRGQDFRTLPHAPDPGDSAVVDALVRDIRARQEMVRSSLEDDEFPGVDFIGAARVQDGVDQLVARIRGQLNLVPEAYYASRTPEDAFRELRARVEKAGVFVLLMGNLGSHHTSVDPDIFRGFALADRIAPFVVINDQDAKAAWSFTLLHELAHLWVGQTGISAGRPDLAIEKFCNEVASNLLLPESELVKIELAPGLAFGDVVAVVEGFARPRKLSYSLVAYRLFLAGRISHGVWVRLSAHFRDMWRRQRANARALARENDAGGPNYYVIRRQKLGNALLSLVRQYVQAGELTPTKAARILGVKPRSVIPLLGNAAIAEVGGRA